MSLLLRSNRIPPPSYPSIVLLAVVLVSLATDFLPAPGLAAQSILIVNTTEDLDDGTCDAVHCSLREAIVAANQAMDGGIIHFDIPGPGPHTIQVLAPLPSLEGGVTIDGTTEPDYTGSPVIEVDGSLAGETHGLDLLGTENVIRGLAINRFAVNGISINTGSTRNVVEANFIGTDVTGTIALGNGNSGVLVGQAPDNTVGGTAAGAGNLISGNSEGVAIVDPEATGNVLAGNYIGTDVTGTLPLPNGVGILLLAPGNTIGGTEEGAGNLISGNDLGSITVSGSNATGNVIQGNFIGTDLTGTVALGNGGWLEFMDAPGNTLGGPEAGAGNVISANTRAVRLEGMNATGNVIQGNIIGLDVAGTAPLGNSGAGIRLSMGASENSLGGTGPGEGNIIAHSGWHGIVLVADAGSGNEIRSNSIFENGSMGIELNRDAVTLNDDMDADSGPNGLQNFPVLTAVSSDGGATVEAMLSSAPSATYSLDFFSNDACDDSGYGEGRDFLGTATVATDAGGSGSAVATFSSIPGSVFTATATDAQGNTSEFSQCVGLTTLNLAPTPSTQTVAAGQSATYTVVLTAQGGSFAGSLDLSCSGAPARTTCTFDTDRLTLSGGQASAIMTVTTVAPSGLAPMGGLLLWGGLLLFGGFPLGAGLLLGRGLALRGGLRLWARLLPGLPKRPFDSRGNHVQVRPVPVAGLLVLLLVACGDDGSSPPEGGTDPGTYNLAITATWESVQETATVTFVVQ